MARIPDPWNGLRDEVRRLWKAIKDLQVRSPFTGTGLHPNGHGGLDSDTFVAGVSGYSFQGDTGNAEFNNLTLRGGIIGNDALTNPVVQSVARSRVTGFGLSNSAFVELTGVNITVPDLCTQAQAIVNASIFSYNPNTTGGSNGTGGDALYVIASIAGQSTTPDEPVGVSGSGGYATVRTADTFNITGLTPGQVVRLSVYGSSAYAPIASNAGNIAKVSAGLSFLR